MRTEKPSGTSSRWSSVNGSRPSWAAIMGPYSCGTRSPMAQLQHLDEQLRRGLGDGLGPPGPPRQDGLEGRLADLLLDRLGQAAGVVVAHAAPASRAVGRFHPVLLAGELHQHHQQRRDVGDGDGVGELLLIGCRHDQGARSL